MRTHLLLYGCICTAIVGCQDSKEKQIEGKEPILVASWFEDVATQLGVDFVYQSGATGEFYVAETIGGAPALLDWDDDGDMDLYIVQGNTLGPIARLDIGNTLYENVDGTFIDRSEGSGADDQGYGIGVATGDYDGDGDVDIYVTNLGSNVLLRNEGSGTFTNVAIEAGVEGEGFSACAAFSDLDLDGDLDLIVTQYIDWTYEDEQVCYDRQGIRTYCHPAVYQAPVHDVLYLNNGDGTFTDVSKESGFADVKGTGLGVVVANLTNDNLPDIFIGNDKMPDRLWVNAGDVTFTEEGGQRGVAIDDAGVAKAGMGTDVSDIDGDGDIDVLVTNIYSESDSLFQNNGHYFQDITRRRGLAAETRAYTRWGTAIEDFDNDGKVDLFEATGGVVSRPDRFSETDPLAEPNLLFQQGDDGRFRLIHPSGGTTIPIITTAHGVAAGDINGDGGVDLVVVNKDATCNILLNVVKPRGKWISFRVRDANGADAIGANLEFLLENGQLVYKQVLTSHGYASAHDPRVHVGLGDQVVQKVTIKWPDGSILMLNEPVLGVLHEIQYP